MTSKEIREKEALLRYQYAGNNKYGIPDMEKQEFDNVDFKFIGVDRISNKRKDADKTIHFFLDDDKLEKFYKRAEHYIKKLAGHYAVLTPDFSLYTDMPIVEQMWSVYKNRWCGAYWQSYGLKVIPTICWSKEESFDFCFLGVPQGSIVAISTLGAKKAKVDFMKGYDYMIDKINPSLILCYDKPFDEMQGNVVHIDYLSCTGRRAA